MGGEGDIGLQYIRPGEKRDTTDHSDHSDHHQNPIQIRSVSNLMLPVSHLILPVSHLMLLVMTVLLMKTRGAQDKRANVFIVWSCILDATASRFAIHLTSLALSSADFSIASSSS